MEHRLSLSTLARDLHSEGRLSDRDFARVMAAQAVKVHPLVYLAEQKIEDAANPGRMLDMDGLLAWLGARVEQPVYQIDPLSGGPAPGWTG